MPGFASLLLVFTVGCPHRSPLWSPDGKWILVLAGEKGENVDHGASRAWLVEAASGKKRLLAPPVKGHRFLAASWTSAHAFVMVTGEWDEDIAVEGSGKLWKRGVNDDSWKAIDVPTPSEERVTRRLPFVIPRHGDARLVYPTGPESVTVVSLATESTIKVIALADLVGPAADDGVLITQTDDRSGNTWLVALDADLATRWKVDFNHLRKTIAVRLEKKPVEVVFNDTSTSHLPRKRLTNGADWVGVTLTFSDVGWSDGIVAYYVRLDAHDGSLISVMTAKGLSGRPESVDQHVIAFTAPEPRKKVPVALRAFDITGGAAIKATLFPDLKKEQVHGYAMDAEGTRLAVSINGTTPALLLFDVARLEQTRKVRLD